MPENHYPADVFKFCPKCGGKGFHPQSEKSFSCESCGFVYYINEASAVVAVIFNEDGKVLFTVRKREPASGTLDLPGGFADQGESAEQALQREIKEELNLDITEFSYFGSFPNQYLFGGITYFTLDLVFICLVEKMDEIRAADDVAAFRFIELKEVEKERIGLDSIRNVVKELRKSFHR